MDPVTAMTIDRGRKNNQLLIQPQYSPMAVEDQVAILYCGTHGLLKDVALDSVRDFQEQFLQVMHAQHADTLAQLHEGKFTEEITAVIESTAADVAEQFKN